MTSINRTVLVNAFCPLTFYRYGTAMMHYFLAYPSRAIVGTGEFVACHALIQQVTDTGYGRIFLESTPALPALLILNNLTQYRL